MNRRQFLAAASCGLPSLFAASCATRATATAAPPNFVFILIDDFGWRDLACYGNRFHETPNIDRLAAEGLRFTDAYAACPVCSPTRASILTGKYPARLGLTDFLKGKRTRPGSPILPADYLDQLPLEEITLAEVLKTRGYATCHVGKWHLGNAPFWPEQQGFDMNIGGAASGMPKDFFWPQWKPNPPVDGRFDGDYLTDTLTDGACDFIRANAGRPFFLYLSHYATHIPLQAKEEKIAFYQRKLAENPASAAEHNNALYAAMVESVDDSVGAILDTLRNAGIDDNTVVVFFTDNGGLSVQEGENTPATTNAPLREGKGYLYEGGIRVPCIVRWPRGIEPGGTSSAPIISNDFFPTFCALADGPSEDSSIDGVDLGAHLRDPRSPLPGRPLFWHYPHFSNQGGMPGAAVRVGEWKLIEFYETGALELYNLREDLSESINLSKTNPDKARELLALLRAWREEVNANMPRLNAAG